MPGSVLSDMTLTTFRPSAENVSPTVYSVLAGFAATLIDSTVAGFGFSARGVLCGGEVFSAAATSSTVAFLLAETSLAAG